MFTVGKILKSNAPYKAQTGLGNLSRVLVTIDDKYLFSMSGDGTVFQVHEHRSTFFAPTPEEVIKDDNIMHTTDVFKPHLGFEYGDFLPHTLPAFADIMREFSDKNIIGRPIFVGLCESPSDKEVSRQSKLDHVHIVFVELERDGKITDHGGAMKRINMTKDDFASQVFGLNLKKSTVHYIDNNGVKTHADVDNIDEIKDMKKLLYKFDNN
jgi:hypothetical protein